MVSLYIVHDLARVQDVLGALVAGSGGARRSTVFSLADLDEEQVAQALDGVGGEDSVNLIHVLTPSEPEVSAVAQTRGTLEKWFPALNLRQWLVIDVGRAWEEHEKRAVDDLRASEPPIEGILVVSGSTTATVTADERDDDLTAMSVDAAWALGVDDFGNALSAQSGNLWGVGTASFTLDEIRLLSPVVAAVTTIALDSGPLHPQDVREGRSLAGRQWVKDDRDLAGLNLLKGPRRASVEELRLERSLVESLIVEDWADGVLQQYRARSGAPLSRVRREIKANGEQILNGRVGEQDEEGLISRVDQALEEEIRKASGIRGGGSFLVGVTEELDAKLKEIRSAQEVGPKVSQIDEDSEKLTDAVVTLPNSPAWVVRGAVVGSGVAIATIGNLGANSSFSLITVALALGAVVAGLTGVWGMSKRRAVTAKRTALVDTCEDVLTDHAENFELEERLRVVTQLKNHVGSFVDDQMQPTTDIDEAALSEFQTESLCTKLLVLREELGRLRVDSVVLGQEDDVPDMPRRSLGDFMRFFPDSTSELEVLGRWVDEATKARLAKVVREVFAELSIGDTCPRLEERISIATASGTAEDQESLTEVLEGEGPARVAFVDVFARENRPVQDTGGQSLHGDVQSHLHVFGPPRLKKQIWLPGALQQSGDFHVMENGRRVVACWLAPLERPQKRIETFDNESIVVPSEGSEPEGDGIYL